MLISVQVGKNQLDWAQESTGYAPMLSHCSLLRNLWPKPTGVLEHYSKGDTNFWFYLSGRFLLTASLRRRRMSMYISLLTVAISVNYTSDSWVIFEASTYNWSIRVGCSFIFAVQNAWYFSDFSGKCKYKTPPSQYFPTLMLTYTL